MPRGRIKCYQKVIQLWLLSRLGLANLLYRSITVHEFINFDSMQVVASKSNYPPIFLLYSV